MKAEKSRSCYKNVWASHYFVGVSKLDNNNNILRTIILIPCDFNYENVTHTKGSLASASGQQTYHAFFSVTGKLH